MSKSREITNGMTVIATKATPYQGLFGWVAQVLPATEPGGEATYQIHFQPWLEAEKVNLKLRYAAATNCPQVQFTDIPLTVEMKSDEIRPVDYVDTKPVETIYSVEMELVQYYRTIKREKRYFRDILTARAAFHNFLGQILANDIVSEWLSQTGDEDKYEVIEYDDLSARSLNIIGSDYEAEHAFVSLDKIQILG